MSGNCSIRYAAIAALGVLAILWGQAGAAPPPDAADVLEVKVLDAQVHQGQGERFDVVYRMEVLSVLRSSTRVQPGETITVHSYGQSNEVRERGWMGTAYLNRDRKGPSPGAGLQFVVAAQGEGLVDLPSTPPSATSTIWTNSKGEVVKWQ
jgi:hypothetical protein